MAVQTYNIGLRMDPTTAEHWLSLLTSARDAFNMCSSILSAPKANLSFKGAHAACYDKVRAAFPNLPSQCCIRVQKEAASMIKSMRSNKVVDGDVPTKKSLSMTLDKRLYGTLNYTGITLSNGQQFKRVLVGFSMYPKAEEMLLNHIPSDPTIFYRDGRFFLSVPFKVADKPCKDDVAIGVDLGMKRLFVTSEGNYLTDKDYLKRRRKVRYLKRVLKSKGTHSAKRHLKKLKHKETNISKNYIYKAVNSLIKSTDASVLVLEDLKGIKKKTSKAKNGYKRKTHNRAISQVPFYKFKEVLTYKALLAGKRVETVSPAYTSQTDSSTHKRDGKRQGCRYYCSNGVVYDADFNAAVNICQKTKHPVSTRVPIDGTLMALTGTAPSTAESLTVLDLRQAHDFSRG